MFCPQALALRRGLSDNGPEGGPSHEKSVSNPGNNLTMSEPKLLQLHIEELRVLARTNQPNRGGLIERNIDDYLSAEPGNERPALERLRDAIDQEEAEKREGEDWSIAKHFVHSWLSWLA